MTITTTITMGVGVSLSPDPEPNVGSFLPAIDDNARSYDYVQCAKILPNVAGQDEYTINANQYIPHPVGALC